MGVFRVSTGLMIIAIICLYSSTVAAQEVECHGLDQVDCHTKCNSQSCKDYIMDGEPDEANCADEEKACLALKTLPKCGCLAGTKSQWLQYYTDCIPKEQCGCKVGDEYVELGKTFDKTDGTTCKCEPGHQCNTFVGRLPARGRR